MNIQEIKKDKFLELIKKEKLENNVFFEGFDHYNNVIFSLKINSTIRDDLSTVSGKINHIQILLDEII